MFLVVYCNKPITKDNYTSILILLVSLARCIFRDRTLKCVCINCGALTSHDVLLSFDAKEATTEYDISYQVIECCGCESKSFRYSDRSPLNGFAKDGNDFLEKEHLFPPRYMCRKPVDLYWVHSDVRRIYREVHLALRNEMRSLAAIGIRLTVEKLCAQKKVKGSRLVDQIADLCQQEVITEEQMQGLHCHRFIGNDAAHGGAEPGDLELSAAMDILDSVLVSVYILPARRKRMNALRRQRKM